MDASCPGEPIEAEILVIGSRSEVVARFFQEDHVSLARMPLAGDLCQWVGLNGTAQKMVCANKPGPNPASKPEAAGRGEAKGEGVREGRATSDGGKRQRRAPRATCAPSPARSGAFIRPPYGNHN